MNKTKQQSQALDYFNRYAKAWRAKAENDDIREFNVIRERNKFVIDVARENGPFEFFLDVGCGAGDLVIMAAEAGIQSTGVDFAEEMIKEANQKKTNLPIEDKAAFIHESIFDFPIEDNEYDLISANGFIEYISFQELEAFFDIVSKGTKIGGSFICGSRNRLFNIFSLNNYTIREIESGFIGDLLSEAVLWATTDSIRGVVDKCKEIKPQDKNTLHPGTGIGVESRFQYTPVQLIKMLERRGFSIAEVCPVNVHGVNPKMKSALPDLYDFVANALQPFGRNETSMIMQASTFMLHLKKIA